MTESRLVKVLRLAFALVVVSSVAGCDTLSGMNPFGDKKKPLPGERRPVPKVAPSPPDEVPQPLTWRIESSSKLA
ncbi:hypothetical protein [Hansschlegelia sp. KR7-227]|uniref:hypothetical protein n=1 Tax=Hansschlegelia sp. KR7-227 TaxID=3400914 RepID=UPI003C026A73